MVENDATVDSTSYTSSEPDADSSGYAALELNEVFTALQHSRRRYVLDSLATREREQTLTELATGVVAWEQDKPRESVTEAERERCRTALYHSHVPKLAELGVLDYETGDDIVVRATDTEQLRAVLDSVSGEADGRLAAYTGVDA